MFNNTEKGMWLGDAISTACVKSLTYTMFWIFWPKGIALKNRLGLWYQNTLKYDMELDEKKKSIDDPYNPLKKSKGKAEDGLIKHLECIRLVILYKNVRGYGTASGLQVRTRPGTFCFSLRYFRKGTQALCGTCRFLEVKKNFVQ